MGFLRDYSGKEGKLCQEGYVTPVVRKKTYGEEKYVLMDTLYVQNAFMVVECSKY